MKLVCYSNCYLQHIEEARKRIKRKVFMRFFFMFLVEDSKAPVRSVITVNYFSWMLLTFHNKFNKSVNVI